MTRTQIGTIVTCPHRTPRGQNARMTDARSRLLLVALTLLLAACSTSTSSTPTPTGTPTPQPTATASPTATPTATPTPRPTPTAEPTTASTPTSGTPGGFTIAPNAEADALFLVRDDCQNLRDGYRVSFPEDWWTNTEIGDFPPCIWFSPTFYQVPDVKKVPDEIAIVIEYHGGDVGTFEDVASQDSVTVGGQPASRIEERRGSDDCGATPDDWCQYSYLIQLGPTEEEGPNLLARTNTEMGGHYELNTAVLDRIMATLELIGSVQ